MLATSYMNNGRLPKVGISAPQSAPWKGLLSMLIQCSAEKVCCHAMVGAHAKPALPLCCYYNILGHIPYAVHYIPETVRVTLSLYFLSVHR